MSTETIAPVAQEDKKEGDLRFVYFGRKKDTNVHAGVACIGYSVKGNKLTLSVAFCGPQDIFSKKKARSIIIGRMASKAITLNAEDFGLASFEGVKYEKLVEIIKDAMNGSMPKGKTIYQVVKESKHKVRPAFANVFIPWWFDGVHE